MILEPSADPPQVMHIDLNSAFAMTEQQANPLLRGRPVGVTNRMSSYAICIASSYEAKRVGIGLGTRAHQAHWVDPGFVMVESNPDKYRHIYQKLRAIFESYSPEAYMKSVDEGIIDFKGMDYLLRGRPLEDIAQEIKQRVADEVGDYMTVNIGIAQNRWLAKVAAGFNKPNGLLTIDRDNIEAIMALLSLTDLPYISTRNKIRLNDAGIYTAVDFYRAPYWVLFRTVFKGVVGHHWYLKLRGYETEKQFGIRTIGRNYVLEHRTADHEELATLFHKASVKVGRRLVGKGLTARGMSLGLHYASDQEWRRWHGRNLWYSAAWRSDQLFDRTMQLFATSPPGHIVSGLSLTAYALEPHNLDQPNLFEDDDTRRDRLELAVNDINDRYGELTIQPAAVAKSKNPMKDKVPFGSIRYFD
jgi:DNA polymerase IV